MGRVVILAPVPASAWADRFPDGTEVVGVERDGDPVAACRGADVVIADWTSHHRVTPEVVEALAGTCRLVQVPAAGLDSVDVEACLAAGVPVAGAAGLNDAAVAEWCVWAALDALHACTVSGRLLDDGEWDQFGRARLELAGRTVGIVGMGAIGRATAERLRAFGVELRYWTRTRRDEAFEEEHALTYLDLEELIASSQVLILAVALTEETRGLLSRERIASLPDQAVVVNAARGAVLDDVALAEAVADGRLHGAAVDVFSEEPTPPDDPLVHEPRIVTTPHVAGSTVESIGRILDRTLSNANAALTGDDIEGSVG